ncbi:transmembrane channel-like protein 7 isoform X1 [Melanotaenia boesemani]|uniref:transmembrane channel-like protein 7 isoform X1 n=1 Tax=Melanotaenia boesemani TaxID=1250792 RepID=UPI001C0582B4|nr:transmembrane channel-like protein 7 isoform X1 [Melanotaenia boesemani]
MEEKKNVNFMRLLSDESTGSTLSSDSCEYYQTEIFDLLPSIQASRPEQNRCGPLEAAEGGPGPAEGISHGHLSREPRDKLSVQPLRNLAMCIQAKRGARERRRMQISNIGFWESWRRSQSINRKRAWAQMGQILSSLLPWQHMLHKIEGRFGVGVKAYFVFLRYLIFLNLLHCILIWGFIMGPTTFFGRGNHTEPLRFGENDSVLNFFLGTGFLDRSPAFFGFYTRGSLSSPCLNTPLLYLAGIFTIILLSFIMVVRRTTVGYKHTWMLGKRYSMNVCLKVFCGWDFTIHDPAAAILKQSFIRNDLKLFLEEQSFALRKAERTLGQKVRLYLLRFILNLLVLCLLGGAFSLIYISTTATMEYHWFIDLVIHYLPPFAITFVNLVLPHMFRKISSFEDYSFTVQVNTTLVRSIILKLGSLGMYLFFIINKPWQTPPSCRENQFGREMYKLCIFSFLTTFCNTFLFNYPRKLLQDNYPRSLLSGKQYFLIPFHVLDLVYGQTVSWVGVYYCPLLPLIGTIFLIATLYIKKFSVLRCCVAEQRVFRGSNSSVLFHFMLLLGLLMAVATLSFDLYLKADTKMFHCGPFIGGENVFNVTGVCVKSLPSPAQTALRYLTSEAFAFPLLLAEIIILTSYVSRGRANQKAIERLKDMLVMTSSDKRFLVKQHATLQRSRKNASRVRSAC